MPRCWKARDVGAVASDRSEAERVKAREASVRRSPSWRMSKLHTAEPRNAKSRHAVSRPVRLEIDRDTRYMKITGDPRSAFG